MDQICIGFTDDSCATLPQTWLQVVIDAGLLDGAALSDGGAVVLCACATGGGRRPAGLRPARVHAPRPLGAYFANMAHLEAASVPAFVRMRDELRALRAPRGVLLAVEHAIRDELRHARIMGRLAHRFGGVLDRPRVRRFRERGVEAMARENAIEGCVRETFGALVATWQAHHATDAAVRRAMAVVARDETAHAELSFRVARFLDERLDARGRSRIRSARRRAIAAYRERSWDVHPDLARVAGVPSAKLARELFDSLDREIWTGSLGSFQVG